MKTLLTTLLLFAITLALAQTKLISFKSHSGTSENFNYALNNNLLNDDSNLGVAPERWVTNASLDSVIIITKEKAVLVTSEFCHSRRTGKEEFWKPGRDTVYNTLFSKNNIDSVKTILKKDYNFQNNIDDVVFVKQTKRKKYKRIKSKSRVGNTPTNKTNNPENVLLFGVLVISGAAGVYSWKKNKNEK